MPPLPVIADVYRVALLWTHSNGQLAVNVIHIHDNAPPVTDAVLRSTLDAAADPSMWLTVSNNASVTDIAITPLDGISGTTHGAPATPAHWVGGNPDPYTPQVAVVVKLQTGFRGRSNRGRVFLPFSSTNVVTDGAVNPTTAANMTAAWGDFQDDLVASGHPLQLDVASYKLSSARVVVEPINVEAVAGTQRRRQGRLRGA